MQVQKHVFMYNNKFILDRSTKPSNYYWLTSSSHVLFCTHMMCKKLQSRVVTSCRAKRGLITYAIRSVYPMMHGLHGRRRQRIVLMPHIISHFTVDMPYTVHMNFEKKIC